jgi:hypothetical protein
MSGIPWRRVGLPAAFLVEHLSDSSLAASS